MKETKVNQPKVTIEKTLVVLVYPILDTKFQGHGSVGSWEDF